MPNSASVSSTSTEVLKWYATPLPDAELNSLSLLFKYENNLTVEVK